MYSSLLGSVVSNSFIFGKLWEKPSVAFNLLFCPWSLSRVRLRIENALSAGIFIRACAGQCHCFIGVDDERLASIVHTYPLLQAQVFSKTADGCGPTRDAWKVWGVILSTRGPCTLCA